MKPSYRRSGGRNAGSPAQLRRVALAACLGIISLTAVSFADEYMPTATEEGGIIPNPVIQSQTMTSNGMVLRWKGFHGPYRVQQSTNAGVLWTNASDMLNYSYWGTTNASRFALTYTVGVSEISGGGMFRIVATNRFKGVYDCAYCHDDITMGWAVSPHAGAYNTLTNINEHTNSSCLACHTVGYGIATGFSDTNSTPHLAGVQCENCHGAAVEHAGQFDTPAVTRSPMLCGGCHQGDFPMYDEWTEAVHGEVGTNIEFYSYYTNTVNTSRREGRMGGCGFCHSSEVRLALLTGRIGTNLLTMTNYYSGAFIGTNVYYGHFLPDGGTTVSNGIACVACHDPHREHTENGGHNLRNPLYSTNYYALYTSIYTNSAMFRYTNATYSAANPGIVIYTNSQATNFVIAYSNFWMQYNPNIMVCGQCHSARNTDMDAYVNSLPHHSHQYNMNAANIGNTVSTNDVPFPVLGTGSSRHGINTNGATCTICHMYSEIVAPPGNTAGNISGHSFEVATNGCYTSGCHDPLVDTNMYARVEETMLEISNEIQVVIGLLNNWAAISTNAPTTNQIPLVSGGKTVVRWEYPSGGGGSQGSLTPTNFAVPSSSQQQYIIFPIKEARHNLYLIAYDGTWGVHNPDWARYLIQAASNKIVGVTLP